MQSYHKFETIVDELFPITVELILNGKFNTGIF